MTQVTFGNSDGVDSPAHYSPIINKIVIIFFDCLSFIFSMLISVSYATGPELFTYIDENIRAQILTLLISGVASILWFWGGKRHYSYRKPFWDELKDILFVLLVMALISISVHAAFDSQYSTDIWWLTWSTVLVLVPLFRSFAKLLLNKLHFWQVPSVIIGEVEDAESVYSALQSEPSTGFNILAIVVPTEGQVSRFGIPCISQAEFFNRVDEFHKVFIAVQKEDAKLREFWIRESMKRQLLDISVVPALSGIPLYGTDISHFFSHEVMMLRLQNNLPRKSSRFVKRLFDIVGSTILLILFTPLFLVIAWRISRDGGPVTYVHERIGLNGNKFNCLKFRSMVMNSQERLDEILETDPEAKKEWDKWFKLKNDPRITPIGHLLRETSLDELPQLWNVFKGEMSLVGPRPVVHEELQRYGDDVDYYLCAKPGISGLWQVNGRSDIDYSRRVYLDCWYVKNWSLWNDIVILFKTVNVVLRREGAY